MTFLNRECIHSVQNLKNTYKFTKKKKKTQLPATHSYPGTPTPTHRQCKFLKDLSRETCCMYKLIEVCVHACACMCVCMCICVCKCAYRCSFVSFWLWKMQKQTKCYHGNPCSHHPTSSSINLRIILFQSHTPVPSQTSQHSICKYFCVSKNEDF